MKLTTVEMLGMFKDEREDEVTVADIREGGWYARQITVDDKVDYRLYLKLNEDKSYVVDSHLMFDHNSEFHCIPVEMTLPDYKPEEYSIPNGTTHDEERIPKQV